MAIWIFDLDGTLVKSSQSSRRAVEAINGRAIEKTTSGMTDSALMNEFGVSPEDFVAEVKTHQFEKHPAGWALLNLVIRARKKTAVLTGTLRATFKHKLQSAGINWEPDRAIHCDEFDTKEAAAYELDALLRSTHWMRGAERFYVGDKAIDLRCAKILDAQYVHVGAI